MIPAPYAFDPELTDPEFAKLGVLSLRWAHLENLLANCLKLMLRLTEDEAIIMVFPLSLEQRLNRISAVSELTPLPLNGQKAREELKPVMKGI